MGKYIEDQSYDACFLVAFLLCQKIGFCDDLRYLFTEFSDTFIVYTRWIWQSPPYDTYYSNFLNMFKGVDIWLYILQGASFWDFCMKNKKIEKKLLFSYFQTLYLIKGSGREQKK